MAKLNSAERNALPASQFALPGKRGYPIPDTSHAEQALRMRGHASPGEQKQIVAAVAKKFPQVGRYRKP
jgi:hypothetical protein